MNNYIITTHRGREGATLSLSGNWGNLPFEDEGRARAAAVIDAAGRPFTIETKHVNKSLKEFSK